MREVLGSIPNASITFVFRFPPEFAEQTIFRSVIDAGWPRMPPTIHFRRAHGVVGYHARLACERCWVQFPMRPVTFAPGLPKRFNFFVWTALVFLALQGMIPDPTLFAFGPILDT